MNPFAWWSGWKRAKRLEEVRAERRRRTRARAERKLWDLYVHAPTHREARRILEVLMIGGAW